MPRLRTAIAGLTAVHFAVGIWVSTSVPGPLLSADDLAYMAMGRTLAGQGASSLAQQPPYGFLYPLLTTPGWLLGLGENSILTWARVVNALLGSLLIPVLYCIARRVMSANRRLSLFAAVLGSSLPALWLTASIAWTENLLAILVGLSVLALERICRTAGWVSILGVVASAGALEAAHARMAPIAAGLVISAAFVLIGRARWTSIASLLMSAGVLAVVIPWISDRVQSAAFGDTATYALGDLSSTRSFGEVPDMVVHAMGTAAYLVLAGVGVTVVGAFAMWRAGIAGRVLVAAVAVAIAEAGWFLIGVQRSDAYLHGRYVEVFAPVLVTAGIVGLTRITWPMSVLIISVGTITAGLVAAWAGPGDNWSHPRSPVMMLGVDISGAPFGSAVFEPGAAASVALIAGLVLAVGINRSRFAIAGFSFVLVAAIGVWSGSVGLRSLYNNSTAASVDDAIEGVDIGRLLIGADSDRSAAAGALAWRVGFDSVTTNPDDSVTHSLMRVNQPAPVGAVEVADFGEVILWQLER